MKFSLKRKITKFFFREQWSLLVCGGGGEILSHIVPPRNVIWADPFPVETEGKTYIFAEQQTGYTNGILGYLELYPDFSHSSFVPILERDYHLSFPHVFCLDKNGIKTWYMIPESHEHRSIDLYRAADFPRRWVYEMTLMNNIDAVDSAVFFHETRWWLFTSLNSGSSLNDNLNAFYADSFPSEKWTAHPLNPLCSGLGNSRMAGSVFKNPRTGLLNRPAQSCLKEYGEKIQINEISELSTAAFRERIIAAILPERGLNGVCTHTLNHSEHYLLRDIKTRTFRFLP
jgi:hypothetical protein